MGKGNRRACARDAVENGSKRRLAWSSIWVTLAAISLLLPAAASAGGAGFAYSHKGLPAGVPVPDWAKGKHIYFSPNPAFVDGGSSSGREKQSVRHHPPTGPAGNYTVTASRCENFYCPTPPLSYLSENEGVQHSPHIYPIFWGSNWTKSPGIATREEVMKFFNGLSGSNYQNILTQYFDATGRISSTVAVAPEYIDESVSAPTAVEDQKITKEAEAAVQVFEKANPGWAPGHDDQFIVLPAPGTGYTTETTSFCAYHGDLGAAAYAFIPYMGDKPFDACDTGNPSHTTTFGVSHEYAEAATNPHVGPGSSVWTTLDLAHYEIADICVFTPYELPNGTWATGLWDNNANDCVIGNSKPVDLLALTGDPTAVTTREATLNANVYPEGAETEFYFEYGPTTAYGSSTPTGSIKAGTTIDSVSAVSKTITNLELEKTYHYRVVAKSSAGTTYGKDRLVTTSRWSAQKVPPPSEFPSSMADVSCVSSSSCVAVGIRGTMTGNAYFKQTLAEQWNGSQWTQLTTVDPTGPNIEENSLTKVACGSANACVALGVSEGALVTPFSEFWDGAKWSLVSLPLPSGAVGTVTLTDISCSSTTSCAAVGRYSTEGKNPVKKQSTLVEGWNGKEWSIQTSPNSEGNNISALEGVSCTSVAKCIAVGSAKKAYNEGETVPFAESWDGTKWTALSAPAAPGGSGSVGHIACRSASFCMALGKVSSGAAFTSSWDGTSWHSQSSGLPSGARDVDCAAENSCDVIGSLTGAPGAQGFGQHWNGGEWMVESPAPPSSGTNFELTGLSCPPPGACIAVGKGAGPLAEYLSPWWQQANFFLATGSKGTGNGQFEEPWGIAADSSGNVWVTDTKNNRVEKFNSKGEYQSQFGKEGTGNGQFKKPRGIAIDSSGNLWVLDPGNSRVEKFNSKGEYVSQFSTGSGPWGIAIDPEGNLWMSDVSASRIKKYNTKGELLGQFGTEGTGNGQFGEPYFLASDIDGDAWVGDTLNHRVQELGPKGEYLSQFGKSGTGEGQFGSVNGVAVDAWGTLWVADSNGRVEGFFPEGEYVAQIGTSGSGEGQLKTPRGVAAGPEGSIWVVDSGNNRIEKWKQTPPAVSTDAAKSVKRTEATLAGTINPEGTSTSYQFEYGTTTSFGKLVPASPKSIGSGIGGVKVSEALSGLKAATIYYYRVVATSEKGTIYGETRHLKTLAAAGGGAVVRIGGKTFTELAIKEATFSLSGSFKLEIPDFLGGTTFNCSETGTGTLVSAGLSQENVTLSCTIAGAEKACAVKPITFSVDGTFGSAEGLTTITTEDKGGCAWSETVFLPKATGSFEYGTEAVSLNVTSSATTNYGEHTVYLSGNSKWALTGANAGKTFGFW